MQYVPLTGVALLIALGVVGRSWLQHRRYAVWGIALFCSRSVGQVLRDSLLLLFSSAILGEAVVFALRPDFVSRRMIVAPWNALGSVVLFGGLALLILAQLQLGASWRVGIDERSKPGLVIRGLYTVSRNPIFLGMMIFGVGFTLLIPTLLSLLALLGTVTAIRWQVLEEESYLRHTYAAAYVAYAKRVGRFLPWVGRLR